MALLKNRIVSFSFYFCFAGKGAIPAKWLLRTSADRLGTLDTLLAAVVSDMTGLSGAFFLADLSTVSMRFLWACFQKYLRAASLDGGQAAPIVFWGITGDWEFLKELFHLLLPDHVTTYLLRFQHVVSFMPRFN